MITPSQTGHTAKLGEQRYVQSNSISYKDCHSTVRDDGGA